MSGMQTQPERVEDAAAPHLRRDRRASWFELFFDLAFVAAVAQLSGTLATRYDATNALAAGFALLLLWWAWLGHTFHATRFDEDRADQRLLGLAQVLAVLVIGYGASDPFGARGTAFAAGMAAFKLLLVVAYRRDARGDEVARGLSRRYGWTYLAQAVLWLVSVPLAPPARLACWGMVLAIDALSPFFVARFTVALPPHPEHLPERFGLFTIVLLGEGVAAALHALVHDASPGTREFLVATLAVVVAFLFWVGYFERVRGQGERRAHDARGGRRLRLWAYGHLPLYLGLGAIAAGFVAAAGHEPPAASAPWVLAAGAASAMVGLTTIGIARPGHEPGGAAAHYALALAPLPFAASGSLLVVGAAAAAISTAQLALGRRRGRSTPPTGN